MVPTSGDTNGKSPRRATVRAAALAEAQHGSDGEEKKKGIQDLELE